MNDDIIHLGLIDDDAIALDAAALELAMLDHEETDIAPYIAILSAMTERLADLGGAARTSEARAKMLARVVAGEYGFTGDRQTYDDPANADMIRVIDRRRGLPVALAILYVALARRLHWPADVLNTPAHVLVRIGTDTAPVLIDPFADGAILSPEALSAMLSRVLGRETAPLPEHLAPLRNRMVLVRLLLNQATRAEAPGDATRALDLFERITIIAPANGHGWWERARLELGQGDVSAARGSLSAMLEMTRDPHARAQIGAALGALTGSEQ